SLTARRPRMSSCAPSFAANSTRRPSKLLTVMRGSFDTVSRMRSTRSCTVKIGCFDEFVATATTRRSTYSRLRSMRSSWPRVIGSKLPAYSAVRIEKRRGRIIVRPGNGCWSALQAVEADRRVAVRAAVRLAGKGFVRAVFDAEDRREPRREPEVGQPPRQLDVVRRIGKGDVVRGRFQFFRKPQRVGPMDGCRIAGAEMFGV